VLRGDDSLSHDRIKIASRSHRDRIEIAARSQQDRIEDVRWSGTGWLLENVVEGDLDANAWEEGGWGGFAG